MKNRKTNHLIKCALIILFLHVISTSMLHAQNPVGAIPGVIDVSPMGAATYTIPIEVVPGTQGMQPNLSIVYNSKSGMGQLGMKWHLAGLSAITRCGQNLYYDDNITAITFTNQDELALDGDRLITLNYLNNQSEFATESENFTRIFSDTPYLTVGKPVKYFTAYTDDGTIIRYGDSNGDSDNLLGWYVSKITDANGNYMTFTYEKWGNEIGIKEIHYTMNSAVSTLTQPYAKVKFSYIDNTLNPNTYFVGGRDIPQTKLLENIKISYKDTVVREYVFTYNLTDTDERTAHLKEIVLKEPNKNGNGSVELKPTTIEWGEKIDSIKKTSANTVSGKIVTGDFNGDGYMDYVVYDKGSNRTFQFYIYNPITNQFDQRASGNSSGSEVYAYTYDINGDGKEELIIAEDHSVYYSLFEIKVYGYNNNIISTISTESVNFFSGIFFGDFNGDSKGDMMFVCKAPDSKSTSFCFSSKNGFLSSPLVINGDVDDIRIVDYNGNGKANIQLTCGYDTYYYEYSAALKAFSNVFYTGFPTQDHQFFHGDFNGDGITDIIEYLSSEWVLKIAHGDGYHEYPGEQLTFLNNEIFQFGGYKYPLFIVDINGDGKDDIIQPMYDRNTDKTTLNIFYIPRSSDVVVQTFGGDSIAVALFKQILSV